MPRAFGVRSSGLLVVLLLVACHRDAAPTPAVTADHPPAAAAPSAPSPAAVPGRAVVRVRCDFDGASVLAKKGEAPEWPEGSSDARRCTREGTVYVVDPGDYRLVVALDAKAKVPQLTTDQGPWYRGRALRDLTLSASDVIDLAYDIHDVAGPAAPGCCHCPFVSIFDGPAFEVLRDRRGIARAGVEVTRLRVPVRGGRIVVRVRELEDEVTSLAGIALLRADDGEPLERIDGTTPVLLRRGDEVALTFRDARAGDGEDEEIEATLLVAGWYDPR